MFLLCQTNQPYKAMKEQLLKIQKLVSGISGLFNAMDQGLSRIEPDREVILTFRDLCFEADKETRAIQKDLQTYIDKHSQNPSVAPHNQLQLKKSLNEHQSLIEKHILAMAVFTCDYNFVKKKQVAIDLLEQFSRMLYNEQLKIEKEIQNLLMRLIMENNREQTLLKHFQHDNNHHAFKA